MPGALRRAGVDLVGAGCDLGPGQEKGAAFPGGRGCGGMERVTEGSQQAGTEPPRQAQVSSAA